jgi:glycosyltransferase involved in cell wall biosynthesis
MNRNSNYDVVVLIITHNSSDTVDASIQSIFDQSFDRNRLKIIVVDNCSTDGTYEKLIRYAKEFGISVYRLGKKCLPTRSIRAALSLISYIEYRCITILSAGDKLYPDYIAKCTAVMDEHAGIDTGVILCETDLLDDLGNISNQIPIFSDSCILMKREHYTQFFTCGVGHKVQSFYNKGIIRKSLTDWFKKAIFSFTTECVYIKETLACTSVTKYDDKLDDLVLRLYLVKRLEIIRGMAYPDESHGCSNPQETIDENLSFLALQYASDALVDEDIKTAGKILLFAEMVNPDIIHSDLYTIIARSIKHGKLIEPVDSHRVTEKSVPPPAGAIII